MEHCLEIELVYKVLVCMKSSDQLDDMNVEVRLLKALTAMGCVQEQATATTGGLAGLSEPAFRGCYATLRLCDALYSSMTSKDKQAIMRVLLGRSHELEMVGSTTHPALWSALDQLRATVQGVPRMPERPVGQGDQHAVLLNPRGIF